IILECFYDENVASYIIEFKTFYGLYEGVVNAHTGNITSIAIKPEEDSAPMFEPPSEDEEEVSFIPHETALAIAISDSEIGGTAAVVKNDLDRERKTYNIIFRSGTTEYSYIIDAVTGDILSFDVVMDS
ncbi:MAG: PepSY domain-containing protein, partial [Clostridia bacterium]|nr:PepSY domain-containing protein [Clostridia bacterium]